MKLFYLNFMRRSEDGSRLWIESCHEEMRKRNHSVLFLRLQNDDENRIVSRILIPFRIIYALIKKPKDHTLIIQYPYSTAWLAPFIGKYVLDTTDTQDLPEILSMSNISIYKRMFYMTNYWSWRIWMKFAWKVRCNSHEAARIAGDKAKVIYDVSIDNISVQKEENNECAIVGCICSAGTERWMDEYKQVFEELSKNNIKFEFVGGTKKYAEECGASYVPWSPQNLRERPCHWLCGLALLPIKSIMKGKLHGKILQYMAAGIPVVASYQGETKYILDGCGIKLCESVRDVFDIIILYDKNRKLAHDIGNKCLEKSKMYSMERVIDEMEKMYD